MQGVSTSGQFFRGLFRFVVIGVSDVSLCFWLSSCVNKTIMPMEVFHIAHVIVSGVQRFPAI